MSLDLDLQLREFCDFMDGTQRPLTIDDILDRTGEVPAIPEQALAVRGRTVNGLWMAAAAAAIALVIVGLALRFLPVLQRDVPPATDNPTTTTYAVAPGADGPLGWTQATPPSAMEQLEEVWAMTNGGFALWTGNEIWTSADGMEWKLSARTPDLADPSSEARSVSDFHGGWLDVGGDSEGNPVVAYSTDGTTWESMPLPETRGEPLMIAASRSTAVVIGMAPSGSAADTVVWISHDGRSWGRAAAIADDYGPVRPERLVFTGTEFVMQASIGAFPKMWQSTDGGVWTEGARYSHGMNWDGRGGVEALTAFDHEPLVLQNEATNSGYSTTFENTKFSGWPSALAGTVSGQPVGGELGVILASPTALWFTPDGDAWTSQPFHDVFGSGGDMIGAAVSDVSVLVAFSPNGGKPIELWLGEPTE